MDVRAIEKLELNKILNGVASYATLPETRALISATLPQTEEKEAKCKETEEKFRKAGADIVFRTLEELKEALI